MNNYLPSKRFTYIIVSIILAIFIVLGVNQLLKNQVAQNEKASADKIAAENNKNITYQQFMAIDSDSDGLKDWEEALWKTDPKKADTDGDGTSDGDEVKANRDPLKPNTATKNQEPNDKIDEKVINDQKKQEAEFLQLSQTEQLSRTLFSQYIAAKSYGPLSGTDKQTILDTATAAIMNATTTQFTLSDIIISTVVSSSTKKQYGNDLASSFFTGTNKDKVESEMVIINRAVKNADENELSNLDPIIESYSKTISKILLVSVPSDAINIHLNLLNDLLLIKDGLQKTKVSFRDPVTGIVGIREYKSGSENLLLDLADIKNYFLTNNIIYKETEYGYVFSNII